MTKLLKDLIENIGNLIFILIIHLFGETKRQLVDTFNWSSPVCSIVGHFQRFTVF